MADDLSTWLLEQVAEDERTATATTPVEARRRWAAAEVGGAAAVKVIGSEGKVDDYPARDMFDQEAEHVANWDPARVLAECEAKRRIVEFWSLAYQNPRDAVRFSGYDWDKVRANAQWTLQQLALPYAEREGFREEWRR